MSCDKRCWYYNWQESIFEQLDSIFSLTYLRRENKYDVESLVL